MFSNYFHRWLCKIGLHHWVIYYPQGKTFCAVCFKGFKDIPMDEVNKEDITDIIGIVAKDGNSRTKEN